MSKEEKNIKKDELKSNLQSKASLLKQLSSRITFGVGGLIGALSAVYLGHPMAVGVLFGGAGALALTTIFAPNKSNKERYVLGGAMCLFLIISIVAYAIY